MKQLLTILLLSSFLQAKHIHNEKYYQRYANEAFFGGSIEEKIKGARIDIVTDDFAIEVDFARKQYEAIGQSLYYSMISKKRPAIILITENHRRDLKHILRCKTVCKKYDIKLWIINKKMELKEIN